MLIKDISPNEPGPYPCFSSGTACGQIGICKRCQAPPEEDQPALRERCIKEDHRRTIASRYWVQKRAEQ